MHIKSIPKQMRLMAPTLAQTLKVRLVQIILQNRLIIRMNALLENNPRALPRAQTPHVREPLLRNDDVEVVFRLIHVRAHGYDTRDTRRVGFAGPS